MEFVNVRHSPRSREDSEAAGGLFRAESLQDPSAADGRLVHSSKRP